MQTNSDRKKKKKLDSDLGVMVLPRRQDGFEVVLGRVKRVYAALDVQSEMGEAIPPKESQPQCVQLDTVNSTATALLLPLLTKEEIQVDVFNDT